MAKSVKRSMKRKPRKRVRPAGWKYKNKIDESELPEGVSQQGEELNRKINEALETESDSSVVSDSESREQIKEKYNEFIEEFNQKAEGYAVALADSLSRNIATKNNYGFPRAFCVAGSLNADKQTMKKHPEFEDFKLPITVNSATGASEQMSKVFGEDGFSENLYETLSAQIAENPNVPQVFSVQRTSRYSNSGLHYITVAPTIDKQGQIIRDESGAIKYSVYSFNKNSITDFDTNESLKTSGHCYNVTYMAYVKEQDRFYNNVMMPYAQQMELNDTMKAISPANIVTKPELKQMDINLLMNYKQR